MQVDTNIREDIGRRIAAARKLVNLRQVDLAQVLGVNKYTVSKWERGKNLPDADTLYAMCKLMGVSSDFLLGLSDRVNNA